MDDNILDGQLCSEYIYSEEYLNFLVRYNNDLQGVYDRFNPACVTIINNRFLVAFRNISEVLWI